MKTRIDSETQIVLGDQFPTGGGLLRSEALRNIHPNVNYFEQNADRPWIEDPNLLKTRIGQGWRSYWSLGSRVPFSFSIPGTDLDRPRQSLGAPNGVVYVEGPIYSGTIYSHEADIDLGKHVKQIFRIEARWATTVAELLDNKEAVKRGKRLCAKIDSLNGDGPSRVSEEIAQKIHGDGAKVLSLVETFRKSPPVLLGHLPHNYFWRIDHAGYRKEFDGTDPDPKDAIVPKGKALPLEFAAREHVLAFTKLGYLQEVLDLRDRFSNDHLIKRSRLRLLQVQFNWKFPYDVTERLWGVYRSRKEKRGEKVEKPSAALQSISEYNRGRPTSITKYILGGRLNPQFTYTEH